MDVYVCHGGVHVVHIIISKNIIYESVQIANVTNRVQYTRYIWLCLKKIKNIQSDRDVHNAMCILYLLLQCYIYAILKKSIVFN